MKFEFDIEVPEATSRATVVTVSCGETSLNMKEVGSNDLQRLTGGGIGDWIPEFDGRSSYTDHDEDRRDFALPYVDMLSIMKREVRNSESQRLIREAIEKVKVALDDEH